MPLKTSPASFDAMQIPGVQYCQDYISPENEEQLLAAVDAQVWQQTIDHRVQIYGFGYRHRTREAFRIGALPEWALGLASQLLADGFVIERPNQLVVNDYQPGQGIFDHIDQDVFGNVVVSISLGARCVMCFTQADRETSREVLLEPRSALVLTGEARWQWKHGIPGRLIDRWGAHEIVRGRRVSLTFRAIPTGDDTAPDLFP